MSAILVHTLVVSLRELHADGMNKNAGAMMVSGGEAIQDDEECIFPCGRVFPPLSSVSRSVRTSLGCERGRDYVSQWTRRIMMLGYSS